jgi:L-ascorbate metabolism protein UlaG (beta-lactamase superfamily)
VVLRRQPGGLIGWLTVLAVVPAGRRGMMGGMRITKLGHACVRIEHDDAVVVVDPGGWTEPDAVDGATAVLVTHEHADHLSVQNLGATLAPVFTIDAVARQIADRDAGVRERVTVVEPGQRFDAGGLPVTAVGELHAVITADLPRIHNSGFLVRAGDTTVYHPGDALTAPEEPVDVLCLPVHAPWNKISEVIDFARSVAAARSVGVHDGLLNENGLALVARLIGAHLETAGQSYHRLAPGEPLTG